MTAKRSTFFVRRWKNRQSGRSTYIVYERSIAIEEHFNLDRAKARAKSLNRLYNPTWEDKDVYFSEGGSEDDEG